MTDYAMLFEYITLAPWNVHQRRSDPFGLADADTFNGLSGTLDNARALDARFSLSAAVKKVARENTANDHGETLERIDERIWNATSYDQLCKILDEVKEIFNQVGYNIV